jgi:CubicO group peptidase (beta-lactamase class C family)
MKNKTLSTGTGKLEGKNSGFPDAIASDPAKLGWMVGSPPPPNRRIHFDDGSYFQFPAWRWSVSNFRQLMPTVNVSRGLKDSFPLKRDLVDDIDDLEFIPLGKKDPMTWAESLLANYTDGIVVLHKGVIVYERYFGVLTEKGQHGAMSITKSFVGTLGAMLVADGILDLGKTIGEYVPELTHSGFGDATIRQLLDMTTAIKFSEDYGDPNAEIWAHAYAGNPLPKPKDYTGPRNYYEFLQTVKKLGNHGDAFSYKTANVDCLGWIIARVTGQSIAQFLSDHIWSRIGCEQDAYFSIDSLGTPFAGGGLNLGLRDMARFGELIRNNGKIGSIEIIPISVVEDIRKGADPEKFKKSGYKLLEGWSYRNMWWMTHNDHDAFMARGVHGQRLFIDPKAEVVIARFASHPIAFNAANDPITIPAFDALVEYLINR